MSSAKLMPLTPDELSVSTAHLIGVIGGCKTDVWLLYQYVVPDVNYEPDDHAPGTGTANVGYRSRR